jgi:hypothetical protein
LRFDLGGVFISWITASPVRGFHGPGIRFIGDRRRFDDVLPQEVKIITAVSTHCVICAAMAAVARMMWQKFFTSAKRSKMPAAR